MLKLSTFDLSTCPFYSGFTIVSIKLLILGFVLIFTSPISGHAVAISAKKTGLEPITKKSVYNSKKANNG